MKSKRAQTTTIRIFLFVSIITLLIVGILLGVLYKMGKIKPEPPMQEPSLESVDCQSNQSCFLHRARYCGLTEGTAEIAGVTVKNEILPNCIFRKTVLHVSAAEPEAFRNLLEGRNMTCPYTKYTFDPQLAYNLSVGLEPCEGSLKDAMTAYLLARNESLP